MIERNYYQGHEEFVMPDIKIPDGFEDTTYANDVSPSWCMWHDGMHPSRQRPRQDNWDVEDCIKLRIWIHYPEGDDGDVDGWQKMLQEDGRYVCESYSDPRVHGWVGPKYMPDDYIQTNDWSLVEKFIQDWR